MKATLAILFFCNVPVSGANLPRTASLWVRGGLVVSDAETTEKVCKACLNLECAIMLIPGSENCHCGCSS